MKRWVQCTGSLLAIACFFLSSVNAADRPRQVTILIDSKIGDANIVQGLSERLAAAKLLEGRDVRVVVMSNEQDLARIPALAKAAVASRPAVIYTTHEVWVEALKHATTTIPVVFSSVTEPVERGFVRSLARSGTNLVGVADRDREATMKRVELLREAFPHARRLMVLGAFDHLSKGDVLAIEQTSKRLKFTVIRADISTTPVAATLASADGQKPDAILPFGTLDVRPGERGVDTLFEYVNRRRIPVVFSSSRVAERGGLMSLREDAKDQARRSAEMVVKILNGSRPSEMAIDQADKFEFVINLKVAKQAGFAIPSSVLLRADRVIE